MYMFSKYDTYVCIHIYILNIYRTRIYIMQTIFFTLYAINCLPALFKIHIQLKKQLL